MMDADEKMPPLAEAEQDAAAALKPGIYLQSKKGLLGTGGTAKPTEFRNFWVTLTITEKSAVMVLLDDDFKPTGIKETFTLETLRGADWLYIVEGEKRYQLLKGYLDRVLAGQGAAKPKPKNTAAPPKQGWWSK